MKSRAIQNLRGKLSRDECVYGMWITLEAPSITEMAVALGLDWVVIDAEHGHLDWGDIVAHLRATVRSETVALVRLAELNTGLIKRALDIGADGIVIPLVETAEQLREAVACAHYPPTGKRGIGAERATGWGQCFQEHVEEAEKNVLVVPIIESIRGGQNIDSLLDVPGVDLMFFGPADYTASAGAPGMWETPEVAAAILATKDKIRARGKQCGLLATSNDNLAERKSQGFRALGVGFDSGLLLRSLRAALASVDRDRKISPDFSQAPTVASTIERPCKRPPESMRPRSAGSHYVPRRGRQNRTRPRCVVRVARRIAGQCRRNLTTGYVTFAPGARLPHHRHTFGETITLLSGSAMVEVEGRMYHLDPLDNVTVPRGLIHAAANRSSNAPAVLHIALASDKPGRELVEAPLSRRRMADDSHGVPGAEHVTRFRLAELYSPGPGASFVDYLNRDLIPGIEMSGGYGLFEPGGRLPAHLHDFDESIAIVQGDATCVVEGRRHTLGGLATALQPRGRIHYFINDSKAPMAMIWVYAGPMPERIVVDEACAALAGDPWR